MSNITLAARNADLSEVVGILTEQRARRLDLVVPARHISAADGKVVIADSEATQLVTEDGVSSTAGSYKPTAVAHEGLGDKLGIPTAYLKKLAEARTDLYDANVNGMLHGLVWDWSGFLGLKPDTEVTHEPYDGNLLLRLLKGDESDDGVLRAVLSPKYKFIDNLDVLLAIMDGIRKAGVNAVPGFADLSERRMIARFDVPEIAALAPKLLDGYRSPFEGAGAVERAGEDRPGYRLRSEYGNWSPEAAMRAAAAEGQGYERGKEPVVWAGLRVSNSDVGGGARTITPEIRVKVCKNGLTLIAEASRAVHLGSTQAEGVVEWSADTQEKELALITSQTVDAVRKFLDPDWFRGQVAKIEALAGVPVIKPEETVREVAVAAKFTKAETDGILEHFFRGGQFTSGGVANAVTSYSQTIESPDRAAELDSQAVRVMEHAARIGNRS